MTADAALARVLALHVPEAASPWAGNPSECEGCRAECLYCEADHPWPCPTVRVITGEQLPSTGGTEFWCDECEQVTAHATDCSQF